ncbi:unnamed protein product, partial [Rotaria sp. Silwood2]
AAITTTQKPPTCDTCIFATNTGAYISATTFCAGTGAGARCTIISTTAKCNGALHNPLNSRACSGFSNYCCCLPPLVG